jgi:alanine-glyoxylate transaminase / serine-glyoxylate transaminase / serine-pyruvate transaminase
MGPQMERFSDLSLPTRLLLGPGPSMVHPRVLRAMSTPLIGHLDPEFLTIMDEVQQMLRALFGTRNAFTIALSGTGSAGMEAALVNIIEPNDAVIVGVNGVFGVRIATIVERCGGRAIRVDVPWGHTLDPRAIEVALKQHAPVKAVAIVHAETSTGVHQPLQDIGNLCRQYHALFIVDAVTSLGGLPLEVDRWNIDVAYSATQKCLSCPPGLAPLTVSDRAFDTIRARKSPCRSWYLDFALIADYWVSAKRAYHHTAPVSMLYGFREALRLIDEEGLDARVHRHLVNSRALMAGLGALGLTPFAQEGARLTTLHCLVLPPAVHDAWARTALLHEYGIEIGAGLGPLQGKVWRIGLMGESSTRANVLSLLGTLDTLFLKKAWIDRSGLALEAASRIYHDMPNEHTDHVE